ncbi:MAG: hypothetical protein JWN30_2333, partial [Bacilli bacterium]|nr:hypothetical protein [Bacilli bacterium]
RPPEILSHVRKKYHAHMLTIIERNSIAQFVFEDTTSHFSLNSMIVWELKQKVMSSTTKELYRFSFLWTLCFFLLH